MNNYDGTYKNNYNAYNSESRNRTPLIIAAAAVLVVFALLCATNVICLRHVYSAPTCTEPGVCYKCGKVGEPALGHDYLPATYSSPSVCSRCGAVTGEALKPVSRTDDDAAPEVTVSVSEPVIDRAAEARAQGIIVSDALAASMGQGKYCTVYSTDCDNEIKMKSRPESSYDYDLGRVKLPFNCYFFGTDGSWCLVRDSYNNYFYVYYPIVTAVEIPEDTPSNNYYGVALAAKAQGVVIPDDFTVTTGDAGQMYNDSSVYYAVNMYFDPYEHEKADIKGTFMFYNPSNPDTYDLDSHVVLYGYYGQYALFEHEGRFFWSIPKYFKKS